MPSSVESKADVTGSAVSSESHSKLLRLGLDLLAHTLYFLDSRSRRCCFASCQGMQPVSRVDGLWKAMSENLRQKVILHKRSPSQALSVLRLQRSQAGWLPPLHLVSSFRAYVLRYRHCIDVHADIYSPVDIRQNGGKLDFTKEVHSTNR